MKLNTLFLFGLLALFFSCNGQNPLQNSGALGEYVTEMDDSIVVVFQDKNNNYWFGSNSRGVYRYNPTAAVNGNKPLLHFTTKNGLSHNRIWEITDDTKGNIYFTTTNGIDKYDGKTFTLLKEAEDNKPDDWKLLPGDLWFKNIKDDGHPYRYDGKNLYSLTFPKNVKEDVYRAMFPNVPFSPYSIYTIYTDSKGRVWFGTGALGVGCYDGKNFTWITDDELTEIHNGPSNGIRSIVEDKNGDFWFSNTHSRYTISANPSGGITYKKQPGITYPEYSAEKDGFEYLSATVDSTGDIWMVTFRNGVHRYNFDKHYYHYYIQNEDLSNALLFSIYKDRQGGLWLGTHTNGVHKWNGEMFMKWKP